MPTALTYPGVYVEEIPSGVRTITGVATSITAFIGRALRGPVNEAITINSYGDFERIFGGLWSKSRLGYAVRDFYLNGGSQVIIVRVIHPNFATEGKRLGAIDAMQLVATDAENAASGTAAKVAADGKATEIEGDTTQTDEAKNAARELADALASLADDASDSDIRKAVAEAMRQVIPQRAQLRIGATNTLILEAITAGEWGNKLRVRVDYDVPTDVPESYKAFAVTHEDLFNLSVGDMSTGTIEVFRNVTVKPSPRQVDHVLLNDSKLVRVVTMPADRPPDTDADLDDAKLKTFPFSAADDDRTIGVTSDFGSDGPAPDQNDLIGPGLEGAKRGLYTMKTAELFNLLCIPPYKESGGIDEDVVTSAATLCEQERAFLLVDPPSSWSDKEAAKSGIAAGVGTTSKNAAIFFPRLRKKDPLRDNQISEFAPCGAVAGVIARTDTERGVWKAPAGLEAVLKGVPELSVKLNNAENGELNPLGINCLRVMPPVGRVIWGARTLQGDDRLASEWKYIPVRRLALYIEESLYRGTQWVVFEPNDEPLWSQIRLNVGAFMHNLFRQGAFQGTTPKEAYFVKCDKETTTQNDINLGIVNIVVGFAPLKPAEFVVIKLQQMTGQMEV